MTNELSINISINGRIYPLRIDRRQEEKYRKAAKMINDIVLEYKKKYVNQDAQDHLAMTAFQLVLKSLEIEEKADETPVLEELKLLNEQLSDYLSLND